MTVAELYREILDADYFTVGQETASYRIRRTGYTRQILYEWSRGATDWRHNLSWLPVKVTLGGRTVSVHRGIYKTYAALRERVLASLCDQRIKRVLIGGYSHGAALAALTFADLYERRSSFLCAAYGFGAPRIHIGADADVLFDGFITVRCGKDIVTHLPPAFLGYRHAGQRIDLPVPDHRNAFACHAPDAYVASLAAAPFGAAPVFFPFANTQGNASQE